MLISRNVQTLIPRFSDRRAAARQQQATFAALERCRAFVEVSTDGVVSAATRHFATLLGLPADQVIGKRYDSLLDAAERDSAAARAFAEALSRGEPTTVLLSHAGKDGRTVTLRLQNSPIPADGDIPARTVVVADDVTEVDEQTRTIAGFQGHVDAIRKSQAVIEFGLDGQILDANDNFLDALGYRLDEIEGQHHSMFVDTGARRTPEYRAFWEKNSGAANTMPAGTSVSAKAQRKSGFRPPITRSSIQTASRSR